MAGAGRALPGTAGAAAISRRAGAGRPAGRGLPWPLLSRSLPHARGRRRRALAAGPGTGPDAGAAALRPQRRAHPRPGSAAPSRHGDRHSPQDDGGAGRAAAVPQRRAHPQGPGGDAPAVEGRSGSGGADPGDRRQLPLLARCTPLPVSPGRPSPWPHPGQLARPPGGAGAPRPLPGGHPVLGPEADPARAAAHREDSSCGVLPGHPGDRPLRREPGHPLPGAGSAANSAVCTRYASPPSTRCGWGCSSSASSVWSDPSPRTSTWTSSTSAGGGAAVRLPGGRHRADGVRGHLLPGRLAVREVGKALGLSSIRWTAGQAPRAGRHLGAHRRPRPELACAPRTAGCSGRWPWRRCWRASPPPLHPRRRLRHHPRRAVRGGAGGERLDEGPHRRPVGEGRPERPGHLQGRPARAGDAHRAGQGLPAGGGARGRLAPGHHPPRIRRCTGCWARPTPSASSRWRAGRR